MYTFLSFLKSIAMAKAVNRSKYPWYIDQGINLSECGPTVGAMALSWATGTTDPDRYKARREGAKRSWWLLSDIYSYLQVNRVNSEWVTTRPPSAGEMAIYHVYGNHFCIVLPDETSSPHHVMLVDPYRSRAITRITTDHLAMISSSRNAIILRKQSYV